MSAQISISENASLLKYNTFGLQVNTRYLIKYNSIDALQSFIADTKYANLKKLHIGGGSNLLFMSDFEGCILYSGINFIRTLLESDTDIFLEIGAGVEWDALVAYCVQNKYYGIENLSLVPGQTGAAAIQNIGAYGVEIADVLTRVTAVHLQSGEIKVFDKSECEYDYRESVFKSELKGQYAIVTVEIKLSKIPVYKLDYQHLETEVLMNGEINLENIRNTIIAVRQAKLPDPSQMGNAGSFFMNPVVDSLHFDKLFAQYPAIPHYPLANNQVKVPAGWLIEQAGWKGKTLGNAGVHDKQALVLVNRGGASANEIKTLAETIQRDVFSKFAIHLVPEVNFI